MKYRIVKKERDPFPYEIQQLFTNYAGKECWSWVDRERYLWMAKITLKKIIQKSKMPPDVVVYEVEI